MTLTLIEGGDVYAPHALGRQSVLIANDKLLHVGSIDASGLRRAGVEHETIDASGCLVVPGFIDPHEHIIGAGGEQGFATRMPEVKASQIALAGITTVVGLLGTDTATRDLRCLHAKASQLWEENITAYMYTGGFELPPKSLLGTVTDDIVIIDKIIGAGEIALSDPRWVDPEPRELALFIKSVVLGGMVGEKAGVTHFHMGPGDRRLGLLHEMLDRYGIEGHSLYATHITRSRELMDDAIAFAHRGGFVDIDVVEENLGEWVRYYCDHGGPLSQLTVSSDAHTPKGSPKKLFSQFVSLLHEHNFTLEEILPIFTSNVANVLKLQQKGCLEAGRDADVSIVNAESLQLVHLYSRGCRLVKNGEMAHTIKQEQEA